MRIGIIGIGPVGQTLGAFWALAGHEVAVGSRDPARAKCSRADSPDQIKGHQS